MKISFDFDSTLEYSRVQDLAKKFIDAGHEVWITTSRKLLGESTRRVHADIFAVAKNLGIDNQVQITDYDDKFKFLTGFDLHFDDSEMEVDLINASSTGCIGVVYKHNVIQRRL